jgi:ribosomal protein S18 acetylase RimI-like enzyme
MIRIIDFSNKKLVQSLFELQKDSYLTEAKLVDFFDIPPLQESFSELIKTREIFIGYFEANKLIGALSYTISDKELTICRLTVHSNHFRKGIGQQLLSYLENNIKGIEIIKVSTAKANEPAKQLYVKNGFIFLKDLEVAPEFYIQFFEKKLQTEI